MSGRRSIVRKSRAALIEIYESKIHPADKYQIIKMSQSHRELMEASHVSSAIYEIKSFCHKFTIRKIRSTNKLNFFELVSKLPLSEPWSAITEMGKAERRCPFWCRRLVILEFHQMSFVTIRKTRTQSEEDKKSRTLFDAKTWHVSTPHCELILELVPCWCDNREATQERTYHLLRCSAT